METIPKKPWYKKWWVIILIVISVLLVIVSLTPNPGTDQESTNKDISNTNEIEQTKIEEKQEEKSQEYKIGDQANLEGVILTVHSVKLHIDTLFNPEPGNKFINVDITIKNNTEESLRYNVLDFKLQDNQSYAYTNAATEAKPYLTVGVVQSGQQVRGFISYEIPKIHKPTKLIYTPGILSYKQLIINLN